MIYRSTVDSPLGKLHLAATDSALTELLFDHHRLEVDGVAVAAGAPTDRNSLIELAERELTEYFAGARTSFTVPTSAEGTDFQKSVWAELRKIPFGQTISYIELARRMGNEKKTRAVGLANGKNPISIIIPCHRVIGANGHLVGYGGGIENKRWLIDFEASDRLF